MEHMSNKNRIYASYVNSSFKQLVLQFRRAQDTLQDIDLLEPYTRWSYPSLDRDYALATDDAKVMEAQARFFDTIAEQIRRLVRREYMGNIEG